MQSFNHIYKGVLCIIGLMLALGEISAEAQTDPNRLYTIDDLQQGNTINLMGEWRYHSGDDQAWADPQLDDRDWEWINPTLSAGNMPKDEWQGYGWFRTTVKVDSTLWDIPLGLVVQFQVGASEVYLNGRHIYSFGKVGLAQIEEKAYWERTPRSLLFDRQEEQVIAVRFSNFSLNWYVEQVGNGGFGFYLADLNKAIDQNIAATADAKIDIMLFAGAPLLFAILHFFLFRYYPQNPQNLYYALVTVSISAFFWLLIQTKFFESDPVQYVHLLNVQIAITPIVFLSSLLFVYFFIHENIPKKFWIWLALGLLINIVQWLLIGFKDPILIGIFVLAICIEMLRVIVVTVINKKPHRWLICTGFAGLAVPSLHWFLVHLDVIDRIVEYPFEEWGFLVLYISMSLYLARTVAQTNKDKEFIHGAFGQYLSPAVVNQIVANPEMIDQLGGEERYMTAFFSDVASFSTISENLTPTQLVHFVNEYLSEMCEILERHGATIDKFEGDAILAFFGAPISYEDHAQRAVRAAIDQQQKLVEMRTRWRDDTQQPSYLHQLQQQWENAGRTFWQVRMGMTAGDIVVGNMGSKNRTDYTMMGDAVNLAARFESGQKIYGTSIMVNDRIYEVVKDEVETRKLDLIQVVGKSEAVTAYEILGHKGELEAQTYQVLELYALGMEAYERFDFKVALEFFGQAIQLVPSDGPSALYRERCQDYIEKPPTDLIYRAHEK